MATARVAVSGKIKAFKTSIDIPEKTRIELASLLNARLVDIIDLKTQIKFAHWNVKGPQFFQLHELFDAIAGRVEEHSDLLAERVTQLGGVASGTAREVAAASSTPEYDFNAVTGEQHVRALVHRVSFIGEQIREAIDKADELDDKDTADIFTEISRALDKDLWFLEAHLQS